MVRLTFKWIFALFSFFCLVMVVDSLPITTVLRASETDFKITDLIKDEDILKSPTIGETNEDLPKDVEEILNAPVVRNSSDEAADLQQAAKFASISDIEETVAIDTRNLIEERDLPRTSEVRPGQDITRYVISLTREGDNIQGRAILTIEVTGETRLDPLLLHCDGLNIQTVQVGIFSDVNAENANFNVDNGVLSITPNQQGTVYVAIIQYTMPLRNDGKALFISHYDNVDYVAMNLHPINGRRVFPCIDEPNDLSTISLTFDGLEYNNLVANSQLEENSLTQFRPLQGPVHTWGMVAHNLNNINLPVNNVLLYVRPGIINQDAQASVAINFLFNNLNEWTRKPYFEIILNQDGRMHILSLPDTNRDWYALSTVCIWEPYILMEATHSVKQRTTALTTIAEAMSRQWFGYAIYPENFRFQWIISGLAKYAGFEMLRTFQNDPLGNDVSLIDVNVIFTTDVIQESLLRDAYISSQPIEPSDNIFDEIPIRDTVNGLLKYKAPAIMRMLRVVLGDPEQDFIQSAARALFSRNPLLWVNAMNFYDAINSEWLFEGNEIVNDVSEFAQPWVSNTGYPLLHVGLRQGGLLLTQEHFSFTPGERRNFLVPITYTTGAVANFDNIHPVMMLDITATLSLALGVDDYVLFNLQGQGYYRVNYDVDLWERIKGALYDPERRDVIHPLNRATLIDDSLNLARAGKLEYPIALEVVLAMELETEYPAWKAFVRNMDFLRKHLLLYIEDEFLEPDIYERMIRRSIVAFEEEIGFEPDPNTNVPAMESLTRGLVMDHACRANYGPCIAAAIDWFYDPNDNEVVNPNIPHEIRPAVYCTMVKEGDTDVIEALEERMLIEPTQYERLVILEAMACSQDGQFIEGLLFRTIADDSPFGVEERSKIFTAVVESNSENLNAAIAFLTRNTPAIRESYGGPDRLDEVLFVIANNIVGPFQLEQFVNWINSVNSNLDDSIDAARRARDLAMENIQWRENNIEAIYEWINENDAPTIMVSSFLILISFVIALFNN